MKRYVFLSVLVIAIGILYSQIDRTSSFEKSGAHTMDRLIKAEVPLQQKGQPNDFIPKAKGMIKSRSLSSKEMSKQIRNSILDDFQKTELDLFEGQFLLVEGVYGSLELQPSLIKITEIGGFFVYEQKHERSLQVFYDASKGQYGVFTGEVIVKGNYASALSMLEGSSFEIVYKNDLIQQIIFKVENVQDVSSLDALRALPGLTMIPDLKFARLKSM